MGRQEAGSLEGRSKRREDKVKKEWKDQHTWSKTSKLQTHFNVTRGFVMMACLVSQSPCRHTYLDRGICRLIRRTQTLRCRERMASNQNDVRSLCVQVGAQGAMVCLCAGV